MRHRNLGRQHTNVILQCQFCFCFVRIHLNQLSITRECRAIKITRDISKTVVRTLTLPRIKYIALFFSVLLFLFIFNLLLIYIKINGRQHTRDNKMCVRLRFYFQLSFILFVYHQSVNVSL